MPTCIKYPCRAPLKAYAYYVGKEEDGPFCLSCAKFLGWQLKKEIKKERIEPKPEQPA